MLPFLNSFEKIQGVICCFRAGSGTGPGNTFVVQIGQVTNSTETMHLSAKRSRIQSPMSIFAWSNPNLQTYLRICTGQSSHRKPHHSDTSICILSNSTQKKFPSCRQRRQIFAFLRQYYWKQKIRILVENSLRSWKPFERPMPRLAFQRPKRKMQRKATSILFLYD
jgi:hypothetical protein